MVIAIFHYVPFDSRLYWSEFIDWRFLWHDQQLSYYGRNVWCFHIPNAFFTPRDLRMQLICYSIQSIPEFIRWKVTSIKFDNSIMRLDKLFCHLSTRKQWIILHAYDNWQTNKHTMYLTTWRDNFALFAFSQNKLYLSISCFHSQKDFLMFLKWLPFIKYGICLKKYFWKFTRF